MQSYPVSFLCGNHGLDEMQLELERRDEAREALACSDGPETDPTDPPPTSPAGAMLPEEMADVWQYLRDLSDTVLGDLIHIADLTGADALLNLASSEMLRRLDGLQAPERVAA